MCPAAAAASFYAAAALLAAAAASDAKYPLDAATVAYRIIQ